MREKTDVKYFAATIVVILIFMATACFAAQPANETATIKDVEKEVGEAAETIKVYSVEQREEAVKNMKSVLDEMDADIDRLEERVSNKWDQMNEAARRDAQATLKALRKKRNQVAEWYGGLKHSSDRAWVHMKEGFSEAYSSLYDAWQKAADEYKK